MAHSEKLHCTWREYKNGSMTTCPEPATECILSGCLNGHLEETVSCYHHFDLWTQWVADDSRTVSRCRFIECKQPIDSWERIAVERLSSGYALYQKTRQSPAGIK